MRKLHPLLATLLPAAAGASTATAVVVRGALRVPVSEEITGPTVIASVPPLGWWLLALAAGAAVGAVLGWSLARREASKILLPLLLPGLANLAYVPGALSVLPFLSAVSGPLLDLLLLGSLAATLWRAAEHFELAPSFSANQVAVVALGLYLLVGYRAQKEVGLTGDEPHYLLIVHSLLRDHDLRVADDYADGSFREFYEGKIGPHLAHGSPYSIHGIGMPLLLLPGYALLGLVGVLLTEAVLGAFAVRELFLAVEQLTGDRAASLVAAAGFGVTLPALFLSTAAYPELAAAALAIAVFRRWISPPPPKPTSAITWGLAFGLLPFFHIKFLPLAAVFGLGSVIFWPRRRWGVVAGMTVALMAFIAFCYVFFGSPNPLASYGTQRVFWNRIPLGVAGLFFDQEFGLLPVSPFYFFALAALGSYLRRQAAPGLLIVATLGAVALPGAAHPLWSGGTSAPARFLFPALPLLAVAAGAVWSWEQRRGVHLWARTLLLVSVLLGAYAASLPGQYLYLNQRDGTGRIWESLGASWDLTHYLPSMVRADPRSVGLAGVGAAILLLAIGAQSSRRRLRLPPLVLTVLAATWLLDFSSPGQVPETARAHWMEELLWGLPGREADRFAELPSARPIDYREVLGLIAVPLRPAKSVSRREQREQGDLWKSAPVRLPSGEFVVASERAAKIDLCNGEGCFSASQTGRPFRTRVGLARFHVRSFVPSPELHLRPASLDGDFVTARQSLELAGGLRLHSLDDNVFYEPRGFWIRSGARADFVLEDEIAGEAVLSLANGGRENWIEIQQPEGSLQFSLRPFETKRLQVPLADKLGFLAVEAATGFRPTELDPAKDDDRELGVFVTAPVFDLSRDPSR